MHLLPPSTSFRAPCATGKNVIVILWILGVFGAEICACNPVYFSLPRPDGNAVWLDGAQDAAQDANGAGTDDALTDDDAGPDGQVDAGFDGGARAFAVAVQTRGRGSGAVTSTPPGIDCGSSCSAQFVEGELVLTATPDGRSMFGGWVDACTGSNPGCTLTVDRDLLVTAVFHELEYEMIVGLGGNGAGAVTSSPAGVNCLLQMNTLAGDCRQSFTIDSVITLTARPVSGSVFAGWSGACAASGASSTCVMTMDAPKTIAGMFF